MWYGKYDPSVDEPEMRQIPDCVPIGASFEEVQICEAREKAMLAYLSPLYAAAPDLLAACKALMHLYGPHGNFMDNASRVFDEVKSAIAKAEGK